MELRTCDRTEPSHIHIQRPSDRMGGTRTQALDGDSSTDVSADALRCSCADEG